MTAPELTPELLPCPWGKDHKPELTHKGDTCWFVWCNCGAQGPDMDTPKTAVDMWNTSASPAPVEAKRKDAERKGAERDAWIDGYAIGHSDGVSCGHDLSPRCRHKATKEWAEHHPDDAAKKEPGRGE